MGVGVAIAAVSAGIGSAAAGANFIAGSVALTAAFSAAATFALSALQAALAPEPPSLNLDRFGSAASGITVQSRSADEPRKGIYGEYFASGSLALQDSGGSDNKYLYLVLVICDHEVEEIGEVWLNDVSITDDMLDGNGDVQSGRFAGKVRIIKHLGASDQAADSFLASAIGDWTSNHRGRGVAYVVARYEWDRSTFPTGMPNLAAWVKGKKIYDPRTTTTKWSVNPVLMVRDYLTSSRSAFVPGLGVSTSRIDDTVYSAEANICEEFVTTENVDVDISSVDASTDIISLDQDLLAFQTGDRVNLIENGTLPSGLSTSTDYYVIVYQRLTTPRILLASSYDNALAGTAIDITSVGSGTNTIRKIAEPRYAAGGVVNTSQEPQDILKPILRSMAGGLYRMGASWVVRAGSYVTPDVDLTDDNIIGPVTIQTRTTRSDRFNTVKGEYVSPLNHGQPQDYPSYSKNSYVTADNGEVLMRDIPQPFVPRHTTAMRLASIFLEKSRQEIVFEADFDIEATKCVPGGTVNLTYTRAGFSSKVFEVMDYERRQGEDENGAPYFYVHLILQETASAVYNWNSNDEVAVDPAPNTTLTDAFTVSVVSGFSLDSILIDTQDNDKTYKILASWDAHTNEFVASGGWYEIFFKRATESEYKSAGQIDGTRVEAEVPQLQPDILYDVQIVAYNNLGVPSQPTTINDFQVGSTVSSTTLDFENETVAAYDGVDLENDTLPSEDWES